jgi:hypothetical protein
MIGFILFSSCSWVKKRDFFVIIYSMILSLSTILLDFIEDLSCNNSKIFSNVLMVDDMHVSLPSLKYRSPPFLMFHHHRVSLCAIQSLICSFD